MEYSDGIYNATSLVGHLLGVGVFTATCCLTLHRAGLNDFNTPISVEYADGNPLAILFFCSSLSLIIATGLLYRCFGQWTAALLSFMVLLFLVTVVASRPNSIVHFCGFYATLLGAVLAPLVALWKLKLWPRFVGLNAVLVIVILLLYWAGTKELDIAGFGMGQRVGSSFRGYPTSTFLTTVATWSSGPNEGNVMKAFVSRCCYCFGAWLILVVNLLVTTAAQVPEESQESPWVSIYRLTDPIVVAYNKSNDRASYQKSFEPLALEARAFTEQETVSLILSAASIEHKGYLYRELSSRLAAIRLAKHCQNEHESKFLEAATSSDFSRLDLTILAAITVLDWKFPKSLDSLVEEVLLESNDLDWLQENASWYLASLVVAAGDQQRIDRLKNDLRNCNPVNNLRNLKTSTKVVFVTMKKPNAKPQLTGGWCDP